MTEKNDDRNQMSSLGDKERNTPLEAPVKNSRSEPALSKFNENIVELLRTLRMLEERYLTIRKKSQVSDQNIIEDTNKIFTQLKLINNDLSELKYNVSEMKEKLDVFQSEIKGMASRQELNILQRYIDMWQPMDFLTEKEALKLIRDELEINKGEEN